MTNTHMNWVIHVNCKWKKLKMNIASRSFVGRQKRLLILSESLFVACFTFEFVCEITWPWIWFHAYSKNDLSGIFFLRLLLTTVNFFMFFVEFSRNMSHLVQWSMTRFWCIIIIRMRQIGCNYLNTVAKLSVLFVITI